jgi:hypothetical protein
MVDNRSTATASRSAAAATAGWPSRYALGMVLAVATPAAVYFAARPAPPELMARTNAADDAELRRIRRELAQLQRESARVRQLVRAGQLRDRDAVDDSAQAATAPDEAPAEVANPVADRLVRNEDSWAQVEGAFASEAVDATWVAARELAAKLANVLPDGASLRSLDCRESMCRVETAHRSEQSYQEFTIGLAAPTERPPIWTGAAMFQIVRPAEREGDELIAVAYLAREAFPSPQP